MIDNSLIIEKKTINKQSRTSSELSSGMYCRVKQLSTFVSEVRTASMMEAVRTSETSVDNYFTRQYIPEEKSELHTRRRENLKSQIQNEDRLQLKFGHP
jgi:predicted extracellular nuclease